MSEKIHLRGMTWDHSRGYDPMVATATAFQSIHPHVEIHWEKRSLQAFADRPIEDMASKYDLMVIDYPHVGEVARGGHLLPLDIAQYTDALAALSKHSVGGSHASYQYDGRQWALAIDAATPVAALRPDRMDFVPRTWAEVIDLARHSRVGFALKPINALMTFMGLAKNKGYSLAEGDDFLSPEQSTDILEYLAEIADLMDSRCLDMDPIAIYEWMSRTDDGPDYSPWGYGYTNYSRAGYCRFPLNFVNAPGFGTNGPKGTVIGGTGIAVSAQTKFPKIALEYAYWIAGETCQKGLFFDAGGQPAHALAWEDPRLNQLTRNFFSATRETLETSWVRPRYDGYMAFQDRGGDIINQYLKRTSSLAQAVNDLQTAYRESRS
ncbi:ABC transporter substrate-binding protein [Rhodobacteraceae bacterium]|nr:ABC transporter substrate-binding protein [Paracoccaceae bacterium]